MNKTAPSEFQLNQPTYLLGIGGMGMSGLAMALHSAGVPVAGSEREPERGRALWLKSQGISVQLQGESGLTDFIHYHPDARIVTSRAVEDNVPEMATVQRLNLPLIQRVDFLMQLVGQASYPIAVAGTAGKTTTASLLTHLLRKTSLRPSHLVGGVIAGLGPGHLDQGPHFVYELDESDGRTAEYCPRLLLVTNLHEEHHSLQTLQNHFRHLLENLPVDGTLLTLSEDPLFLESPHQKPILHLDLLHESTDGLRVKVDGIETLIPLAGHHNLANLRLTLAAALELGVSLEDSLQALASFPGVENRMRQLGRLPGGQELILDFAHAPLELKALIHSLERMYSSFTLVWQPHGYGPLSRQWTELVETFSAMRSGDTLLITEVYYAGGTVTRKHSGQDLVNAVQGSHQNTFFVSEISNIPFFLRENPPEGKAIVLAGARNIFDISGEVLTTGQN